MRKLPAVGSLGWSARERERGEGKKERKKKVQGRRWSDARDGNLIKIVIFVFVLG